MAFLVSDIVGALNSNTGTSQEPEECEVADCTKDLAEELCPKTCSEHRSCKIADCTKPKSSKLCPKTCAKLSKDDSDTNIDSMEMGPDSNVFHTRSSCPDNDGMRCETDSDCTKKIYGGKISEQCSKCVCGRPPLCDFKKCHHEHYSDHVIIY